MRIRAEHTAAIAIDYQERLMPAIHDRETITNNSRILLRGLELLGVPVINSRQYPKGLGDTVETLKEVLRTADVLDKTTFSCMDDTGIKAASEATGRKNVIICGTEAHICCLQTVLSLLDDGYNVIYVTDCTGSRRADDKKYGIKRAARAGAILATYESILFELLIGTASPVFKDISNLVK